MTLTQERAKRIANIQASAGYPKGKLTPINGQEPYPKPYAKIVFYGKRRVYTDEANQRWVKCNAVWWKFPDGIEL